MRFKADLEKKTIEVEGNVELGYFISFIKDMKWEDFTLVQSTKINYIPTFWTQPWTSDDFVATCTDNNIHLGNDTILKHESNEKDS